MILNKDELRFLKENREIIEGLLNKRIDKVGQRNEKGSYVIKKS